MKRNKNIPGTFIEFFCGSANVTQAFKNHNFKTFSTDSRYRSGKCMPDLKIDFNKLSSSCLPFHNPDVCWGSVPCTAFSYGAGNYYYSDNSFKENAAPFLNLLEKYLVLMRELKPQYYFIENPRGRMQNHPSLKQFLNDTGGVCKLVTLSSYGHATLKPTHIFTNATDWNPITPDGTGRGNKNPNNTFFSNLTLNSRQTTPHALADEIAHYCAYKLLYSRV